MGKGQHTNVLERAKYAAEDYLAHFPPERQGTILLGALVSVYGKDEVGADTAVWLAGSKGDADQSQPGIGQSSMVHETIKALRDIGLLDTILPAKEGFVVYPTEMTVIP